MKSIQLISLTILAVLIGISCSQTDRKINSEKLQQRGDLYYAVNEEEPYSGKVFEKYENGQKKWQRTYEDGKLDGTTTSWFKNGQKRRQRSYENGKLDGKTIEWYKNGQKKNEIEYSNDLRAGIYREWYYSDGQQKIDGNYKDGKKDGVWKVWHSNGQQAQENIYKEGERKIPWKLWTKDGKKIETDSVKDRDGHTYTTVKINEKWWMAENLNIGSMINDSNAQRNNGEIEKYCYDNDPDNCEKYGGLYQWEEAMQYAEEERSQGICPDGWHIPTLAEYRALKQYIGDESKKLLVVDESSSATNETGFSALLAGNRHHGRFISLGTATYFWSSSKYTNLGAYYLSFGRNDSKVSLKYYFKENGYSVRCVKD